MITEKELGYNPRLALLAWSACVLGACLCGCRSPMPEEFSLPIRGVVFINDTDAPARNISLSILMLREEAKCSHVPARGKRMVDYPLREYGGNYLVVSWFHRGRLWRSEPDVALTPGGIDPRQPVELVVTLGERGTMKLAITQP